MAAIDQPPPGVTPNFAHPDSIGYQVIDSGIITGSFALLAVTLRIATKRWIVKSSNLDDYLIVIALIFAIGRVVGGCIMVYVFGTGKHVWDNPLSRTRKTGASIIAIDVVYLWAMMFVKLSILVLYNRIFGVKPIFKRACQVLGGIVIFYCVAFTPMYLVGCVPGATRTLQQVNAGQCVRTIPLNIAVGALNIATDTTLLILPIWPVMKLQLSRGRLIGLLLVFGTGIIALAASVVREALFVENVHVTDPTWTQVDDIMYPTIEVNVGIVAACLPILTPLVRQFGSYDKLSSYWSSMRNKSAGRLRRNRNTALDDEMMHYSNSESLKNLNMHSNGEGSISVQLRSLRSMEENSRSARGATHRHEFSD